VYSFGNNDNGRLGLGDSVSRSVPTQLDSIADRRIVMISAGAHTSYLLDQEGRVYSFGKANALGANTMIDATQPVQITAANDYNITAVFGGQERAILMDKHQRLYSFGLGQNGGLGQSVDTSDHPTPTQIRAAGENNITTVTMGFHHTLLTDRKGRVYGFGKASEKQLTSAIPSDTGVLTYLPVFGEDNITSIFASSAGTQLVDKEGKLYGIGMNSSGQIPSSTLPTVGEPTEIDLYGSKVLQVASVTFHALALEENGGVYTFGREISGALGHCGSTPTTVTRIGNHSGCNAISLGNSIPNMINLSSTSVNENLSAGVTVATLSTVDNDPLDTHTYALCGGTDDSAFSISGTNLVLQTATNYEAKSRYSVCLRVTDNQGGQYEMNQTISVIDADEGIQGVCGTAHNTLTSLMPSEGLCSSGNPSDVFDDQTRYVWSCYGESVGAHAGRHTSCEAPKLSIHTVNFNDFNGSLIGSVEVAHGEDALAPSAPVREGYQFIGWDGNLSAITSDRTLTAQYEVLTYRVTFNDHNGSEISKTQVAYGKDALAPSAPVREGYTFTKWQGDYTNITQDTIITAEYLINNYQVDFYDHNGTRIDQQNVAYNTAANAPDAPVREGFLFIGWDTDFSQVKKDLSVNALYSELATYEVRFLDHNGTQLSLQTLQSGEDATAPDTPVREGFLFIGWDQPYTNVMSDLNITAQYELIPEENPLISDTTLSNGNLERLIRYTSPSGSVYEMSIVVDASLGALVTEGSEETGVKSTMSVSAGDAVQSLDVSLSPSGVIRMSVSGGGMTQETIYHASHNVKVHLNTSGTHTVNGDGFTTSLSHSTQAVSNGGSNTKTATTHSSGISNLSSNTMTLTSHDVNVHLTSDGQTQTKIQKSGGVSTVISQESDVVINEAGDVSVVSSTAPTITSNAEGALSFTDQNGVLQSRPLGTALNINGAEIIDIQSGIDLNHKKATVTQNDSNSSVTSTLVISEDVNTTIETQEDGSFQALVQEGNTTLQATLDISGQTEHQISTGEANTTAKSYIQGASTTLNDEGLVTHLDLENSGEEINISVVGTKSGAAKHEMVINGVSTTAEVESAGAKTELYKDDANNTMVKTTYNDTNRSYEVQASSKGEAKHRLSTTDQNLEASFNVAGAKTVITKTGQVETNASIGEQAISVVANPDGSVAHRKVFNGQTTEAVSLVKGDSNTTVSNDGTVTTKTQTIDANQPVTFEIVTLPTGQSYTRFIVINAQSGERTNLDTVSETTPFPNGSTMMVREHNNTYNFEINTTLDGVLEIQ